MKKILGLLLVLLLLNFVLVNSSDETRNSSEDYKGDVDCYSSCVDENRSVCKTEWRQCVSLMERCRNNCEKISNK